MIRAVASASWPTGRAWLHRAAISTGVSGVTSIRPSGATGFGKGAGSRLVSSRRAPSTVTSSERMLRLIGSSQWASSTIKRYVGSRISRLSASTMYLRVSSASLAPSPIIGPVCRADPARSATRPALAGPEASSFPSQLPGSADVAAPAARPAARNRLRTGSSDDLASDGVQ